MRFLARLAGLLLILFIAGSYAGRLHPLGDSLAVFRPAFAILLGLTSLAFGKWWRIGVIAVAVFALFPILWMMRPGESPDPVISVYQKNLLFSLGDPAGLIEDFKEAGADVILLEELSDANLPILDSMRATHPYQLICPAHSVGAVAILSANPLRNEVCRKGSGYAMARVLHPAGEFTAVAIHLHWPYPFGQEAQANAIIGELTGVTRPVVVGGDFNMVPWAGAPLRIANATDTRIAGPTRPTLFVKGYPLPIDHILVDFRTAATVERRQRLGSDHFGVLARIGARTR